MCRLLSWIGESRFIEDFVFAPEHSLIKQSRNALISHSRVNADGFGLAWYQNREAPCIYKDTHPAWSDPNLKQLAHQTKSGLFLAHVRASTGTATSRNNCHPFSWENWSFMHNGRIDGYNLIRKELDVLIPKEFYQNRTGATDSEAIFLIALGMGLMTDPIGAVQRALGAVERLLREAGEIPNVLFAACWSDGKNLYAARYGSGSEVPSLCFQKTGQGTVIASEPLTNEKDEWTIVSPSEAIIVSKDNFERLPFYTSP